MADELKIVLRAINQASSPIDDVRGSLGKLEDGASGLMKRGLDPLRNMLATGLKVAAAGAAAALGGLVAGLGSSVMAASDMEQGVADISAAMGASAEETSKLKTLIGDLGMDPKLKVTAMEAAQAIGTLGTAGLSVDEILGGAARSTVLLANATGADFADAAAIASDVMSLFNIKADQMAKAVDGITSTTIASKFDINDYKLALAQAGGVAATVGVEFDDFNATIAAISPSFASGSDAGTSFKTFLQRLIPQSNEARDAMRDLGLFTGLSKKEFDDAQDKIAKYQEQLAKLDPESKNYAERSEELKSKIAALQATLVTGSNAFFDANGNMKSMAEITGILNTALGGLSEEQKNNALSTIFGTDAMRAAAAMAGMTEQQFNDLKATMAKTDAEESAAKRMDTFKGALEILGGVVDTLKMQIGDKFLPVLRSMVEKLTQFLTDNGPAIVEWAGVLADKLATLIENYLPIFVTKLGEWVTWGKAVAANVMTVVGRVGEFIGSVRSFLAPLADFIARQVSLKDVLIAVAGIVTLVAMPAIAGFLATLGAVVTVVGGAIAIVTALRRAWESDFLGLRSVVETVLDFIQRRFGPVLDAIRSFGHGALLEIMRFVETGEARFSWLGHILGIARDAVVGAFSEIIGAITSRLPGWIATLGRWAEAAWQWIADAIPVTLNKLGEWTGALWQWVKDRLPGWRNQLLEWTAAAWQWIKDAIPVALNKLGEWAGALWQWVKDSLPGWRNQFLAWTVAAWQWIKDAIPVALSKLGEWAGALGQWVKDNLPTWIAKLSEWGKAAWQWIIDTIRELPGKLAEWYGALKQWFSDNLPAFQSTLDGWGFSLYDWIRSDKTKKGTQDAMDEWREMTLFQKTKELADQLDIRMYNLGTSLYEWIGEAIPATITAITDWMLSLFQGIDPTSSLINPEVEAAKARNQAAFERMIEAIKTSVKENAGRIGRAIWQGMIAGFEEWNPESTVGAWVKRLIGAFMDFLGIRSPSTVAKDMGVNFIAGFIQGLAEKAHELPGKVGEWLGGMIAAFNTWVSSNANHLLTKGREVIQRIADGLSSGNLTGAIGNVLNGLIGSFNSVMDGFKNHVYGVAGSVGQRIKEGLASINLSGVMSGALNGLIGSFNSVMDGFKNHVHGVAASVGTRIKEGLASMNLAGAMHGALGGIIDAFNGVMDGFKNHVWGVMRDVGARIMEGISSGIRDRINQVMDALNWLVSVAPQWVRNALGIHSPSTVFQELGQNIMEGLVLGMEQLANAPQAVLEGVAAGMTSADNPLLSAGGIVNNTTDRSDRRIYNFDVTNQGMNTSGDPIEQVRTLNALYAGA